MTTFNTITETKPIRDSKHNPLACALSSLNRVKEANTFLNSEIIHELDDKTRRDLIETQSIFIMDTIKKIDLYLLNRGVVYK